MPHEIDTAAAYADFTARLKILVSKHPLLMSTTLSNVFTMRLVGNKTHGDLAEIAIAEFVNQYMYDFRSMHVGRDLFRRKTREEDITIRNEVSGVEFPVSLKAYGLGPLQLLTDKQGGMFPRLEREGATIEGRESAARLLDDPAFGALTRTHVLPLIYEESAKRCAILAFDASRARSAVARVCREDSDTGDAIAALMGLPPKKRKGSRKHPVYRFYDGEGNYVFEVRYGGASANALQRGLWTHTRLARSYFEPITGWIDYSHNKVLVQLISHALVSTAAGHGSALEVIRKDILALKAAAGLEAR